MRLPCASGGGRFTPIEKARIDAGLIEARYCHG
jgi:hypothetical protein